MTLRSKGLALASLGILVLGCSGSDDAGSGAYERAAAPRAAEPNAPAVLSAGDDDLTADPGHEDGAADACASVDPSGPARYYLSADDSNSMASPVIARRLIELGTTVPASLIRTYEFLNYYNVGYPAADEAGLSLYTELRYGDDDQQLQLQIGVASEASREPRKSLNLTFVLDTSGSMSGAPMGLERAAARAVAGVLHEGDVVSMVTWNTQNAVILDSLAVTGPNDPTLAAAISRLNAGGGTDLNGGLTAGYELAQGNYDLNRLNRVILISDGQANTGVTDEELIGRHAEANDGEGIYLVGVGVGDGVNDTLMDTVTDAGRGAYVYLDSLEEADHMFAERFDEVMDVAARGVQVELTLPWYLAMQTFYGEEYSTDPTQVEPQHLAPGDAMVFAQDLSVCAPEELQPDDPLRVVARWQTPLTHTAREAAVETTVGALLDAESPYLKKGYAIVAYAEALKAGANHQVLRDVAALVDAANPHGTDPELNEIRALIAQIAGV